MAMAIPQISISQMKCEDVQDDAYSSEFLKQFYTFKNDGQLCDVVLIAGDDGKRIRAHRLILVGSCAYFHAMFTGSLRESTENEVTIKGVNGEVLEILVRYCYTGSLDLRGDTIEMIIRNADMMQMQSAVATCCNYLVRNLHPHGSIEIMLFALQMNFITLLDSSLEFICRNFLEVSTTEGFLNLEAEQLIKIISRDDINVPSEECIFDAVKNWLEYLPETQRQFTNQLLACIRLSLLSPKFIVDNIGPFCANIDGKFLVMEALKCHLLPQPKCVFTSENTGLRIGYFHLIAIYREGSYVKMAEFNRTTSTWSDWFSITMDRNGFGITAMNGQIIFSGGMSYNQYCGTVACYDWSTKQLKSLPSMNSSRYGHAMIAYNGSLYVIGGINGSGQRFATVEKLSSESGRWILCGSLRTPRSLARIAVIDDKLYVIGGNPDSINISSVEWFSTDTEKCQEVSSMNMPRSQPGVAAVNGLLYVFGGCDCGKFFERYAPSTNECTLCSSGDNLFTGPTSCASIGNFIYVSSNNSIKEYDVIHNTWKSLCYPTVPQSGFVELLTVPFSNPN